jgi:hypothetical protein
MREAVKNEDLYKSMTREKRLVAGKRTDFCNDVLRLNNVRDPCKLGYPHQRYFQLNLVPISKYGTIEFRAHSATYDDTRVVRWVQFLLAFVEYFSHGKGYQEVSPYVTGYRSDKDAYSALQQAQRKATTKELFDKLKDSLDTDAGEYYKNRLWEEEDDMCHLDEDAVLELKPCSPDKLEQVSLLQARAEEQSFRVDVPQGTQAGSYLQVEMPSGQIHAVQVSETSERQGFHDFAHEEEVAIPIARQEDLGTARS